MDESLTAYLQALAGGAPDSAYLEVRYRVARAGESSSYGQANCL
jgi:hypothetical protein